METFYAQSYNMIKFKHMNFEFTIARDECQSQWRTWGAAPSNSSARGHHFKSPRPHVLCRTAWAVLYLPHHTGRYTCLASKDWSLISLLCLIMIMWGSECLARVTWSESSHIPVLRQEKPYSRCEFLNTRWEKLEDLPPLECQNPRSVLECQICSPAKRLQVPMHCQLEAVQAPCLNKAWQFSFCAGDFGWSSHCHGEAIILSLYYRDCLRFFQLHLHQRLLTGLTETRY